MECYILRGDLEFLQTPEDGKTRVREAGVQIFFLYFYLSIGNDISQKRVREREGEAEAERVASWSCSILVEGIDHESGKKRKRQHPPYSLMLVGPICKLTVPRLSSL